MVTGDLVMLEDELNPVMENLHSAGFEISAVHNHLIDETPHVMYMHHMARGSASQLAACLRAALAVSKTPLEKPAAAAEEAAPPSWVKTLDDSVGRKGAFRGGVLSYAVRRADTITAAGMTIAPAAGVAEAINFQAADSGNVATTGDFALTAEEVTRCIATRSQNNLGYSSWISWQWGSAESVGAGIAAACKHVSTK